MHLTLHAPYLFEQVFQIIHFLNDYPNSGMSGSQILDTECMNEHLSFTALRTQIKKDKELNGQNFSSDDRLMKFLSVLRLLRSLNDFSCESK